MRRKAFALFLALCLLLPVGAFASGEISGEASGEASDDLFAPMTFPEDATIVSATTYSVYTKSSSSMQDAVIQATLYWDLTNDEVYAIRFLQPMLPWDDNGAAMGWACVMDEALLNELADADALVEAAEGVEYAKYLSIGGIVWTGALSSHPASPVAVDYYAELGGGTVSLNDYVRTQEGGAWYVNAAMRPVYFLTSDAPAASGEPSGEPENAAYTYQITYKENNGHGVYFWMSDITFPGNMEAIKQFVTENGFDYDYYADGGITQTADGYWQTMDAVSGATLEETPTYLDVLKTLYNEIQAGNYVVEHTAVAMTAEEQVWWDAFQVPKGMEDVVLYPDEQLALREKNYETVCRFMQGLSPYLYLLYADDVVTGVAYDFSLTKDAMRNSDMDFQKMLDASNAEQYPDWEWKNIQVFQSDDPNIFVIECDGSGTYTVDSEAVRTHADHYLHKFTLENGLIKEYIEFNNPIQELTEMGYRVSPAGGGGSSEEPEEDEAAIAAAEQAWWDAFEVPEGMDVALFPDDQLTLREKNYEAVCRYMQGLNRYLYLLYTDDVKTGVAYDFGGTTNPFNPVMTTGITGAAAMDRANAEGYPDWEWSNYQVYQSDDPNVFLVEVDGHGGTHSDHYMHEFILRDGKIAQYIEFNSPLNEAIENGYEVPAFH